MSLNAQKRRRAALPPSAAKQKKTKHVHEEQKTLSSTDKFTDEQRAAYDAAVSGKPMLVHGPAGTGKSRIIQALLEQDRTRWTLAATSGCAAALLGMGARTLHSLFGLGFLDPFTFDAAWNKVRNNHWVRRQLQAMQRLIIDEISMADARMVVIIDLLLRIAKGHMKTPFGGVQVVMFGDFLQLPPVWSYRNEKERPWTNVFAYFAFGITGWRPLRFELTHVFRQTDPDFIAMLQGARVGKLSAHHRAKLRSRCESNLGKQELADRLDTELMNRNREVEACNLAHLNQFTGRVRIKEGSVLRVSVKRRKNEVIVIELTWKSPSAAANSLKRLRDQMRLQNPLTLAVGAPVIVRANVAVDRGIANGTLGVVVGFVDRMAMYGQGADLAHPTFCLAEIEADAPRLTADEDVRGRDDLLPIVRFKGVGDIVVGYWRFELALGSASERAFCHLVPLNPAWALTVDRTQGATMTGVRMNLGGNARDALNYVAVSRVRGFKDLVFTGDDVPAWPFRANKVVRDLFGSPPPADMFGKPFPWPELEEGCFARKELTAWIQQARAAHRSGAWKTL